MVDIGVLLGRERSDSGIAIIALNLREPPIFQSLFLSASDEPDVNSCLSYGLCVLALFSPMIILLS